VASSGPWPGELLPARHGATTASARSTEGAAATLGGGGGKWSGKAPLADIFFFFAPKAFSINSFSPFFLTKSPIYNLLHNIFLTDFFVIFLFFQMFILFCV
jgi:hypothetical protein